jgi:hypothetical protein
MQSLILRVSALVLILLAAPATAQKLNDKTKPRNDPVNCPYTGGDPALLAKIGVLSLGGFDFGEEPTTQAMDAFLVANEVHWVETAHFKLGFGLGPYKVTQKEKNSLRAELGEIAAVWPDVDPKMRVIDPWMRSYLFAIRLEAFYAEIQEILGCSDEDFPAGNTLWDTTGKYMGPGPYLGQKGKYEILILPSSAGTKAYLRNYFGLRHTRTQRWNIIAKDTLHTVIPAEQHLRIDRALHGHLRFNVAQMLLNGYRHYSYDMPVWLREGLAHWAERQVSPQYNTFDSSEGAVAEMTRKDNWEAPTRKMVMKGEAPSLARMMALKGYAGLKLEHHYATWSIIDFMQREHPGFLGKLIDRISGLVNEQFVDDGSKLEDAHRKAFREELGMTYAQFDRAWQAWVLATYSAR